MLLENRQEKRNWIEQVEQYFAERLNNYSMLKTVSYILFCLRMPCNVLYSARMSNLQVAGCIAAHLMFLWSLLLNQIF